ncbi:hypothetical protein HYC85_031043 [Camellia sinensis]|uniref:Proteasome subunit alpha type n=1 Tax=Camellia sinensis TaxID=4442 RepID=A0A7J7FPP0_CAMSI|nr:hypothetical protein HYC85_031043 [Camellia sinensis]
MSSIGTGYDLSVTTFSPDGRVFQVEYASKAVDNSGTVVGIKCKDGIVMGVEKLIASKMMLPGSNRRIHSVHRHSGMTVAGLAADGRQVVARAKSEATNYESIYKVHDEAKDKAFELEMSWVCEESKRQHEKVPEELLEEAKAAGKTALEEMDAD